MKRKSKGGRHKMSNPTEVAKKKSRAITKKPKQKYKSKYGLA